MNNQGKLNAVCYGEVLWDVFANDKKIGGAPLNVALRMQALGCNAAMISCVGNDQDGKDIIAYVNNQGLDAGAITVNDNYPTGVVQVLLNERGSASYDIKYPSAWDKILLNDHARSLVANANVLIYGSLVCRDTVSKKSLEELLKSDVYKVFDVNLRKPNYTAAGLEDLMHASDFVKFNDEELLEIAVSLGSKYTLPEDNMVFIANVAKLKGVCVTKGKHGATLLWNGALYHNDGYSVTVADTVGAGDSFLAALITGLLTGADPQKTVDFACALGALVAGHTGANPEISAEQVEKLLQKV